MPLSGSIVEVCDYVFNLIDTNKSTLGVAVVYWGDQDKVATSPAVCVEPVTKQNDIRRGGANRAFDPKIEISIILYHSAITSPQSNRRNADAMAEAIEALIHTKANFDGLVIHAYVSELASGYIRRENTVMRASRLTVDVLTQKFLPS